MVACCPLTPDQFGAPHDGVSDDTPGFNNMFSANPNAAWFGLSAVNPAGQYGVPYRINSAVNVPLFPIRFEGYGNQVPINFVGANATINVGIDAAVTGNTHSSTLIDGLSTNVLLRGWTVGMNIAGSGFNTTIATIATNGLSLTMAAASSSTLIGTPITVTSGDFAANVFRNMYLVGDRTASQTAFHVYNNINLFENVNAKGLGQFVADSGVINRYEHIYCFDLVTRFGWWNGLGPIFEDIFYQTLGPTQPTDYIMQLFTGSFMMNHFEFIGCKGLHIGAPATQAGNWSKISNGFIDYDSGASGASPACYIINTIPPAMSVGGDSGTYATAEMGSFHFTNVGFESHLANGDGLFVDGGTSGGSFHGIQSVTCDNCQFHNNFYHGLYTTGNLRLFSATNCNFTGNGLEEAYVGHIGNGAASPAGGGIASFTGCHIGPGPNVGFEDINEPPAGTTPAYGLFINSPGPTVNWVGGYIGGGGYYTSGIYNVPPLFNPTYPSRAVTQTTGVNPAGTTSTTAVMAGLAASITPRTTGSVQITIGGYSTESAANGVVFGSIRWGTGAAPVNGAASTGSLITGSGFLAQSESAAAAVPFSVTVIATALTLGTVYWIDLTFSVFSGGGTATLFSVTVAAVEI